VMRCASLLAQAQNQLQQAKVRGEFAMLVLGRDCIGKGFEPAGADNEMGEIRRLRP
jgi:hypothetical protein